MKTIKISLFFLLFSMISTATLAQHTADEIKQKMEKTLGELTPEQLTKVMVFANFLTFEEKDSEKTEKPKEYISQILADLPLNEQQQLLDFTVMEKYGLNNKKVANKPNKKAQKMLPPPSVEPSSRTAKKAPVVAPVGPTTTIKFAEKEFDFGVIESGEKVSYVYKFTNTGTEPLIIKDAKGSCGCTVPKWPKQPLAPGETAEMLVEFNSRGKSGAQNKRVTIIANTVPAQTFINIKGEVLKKK